jgi:hypothetical protein
MLEASLNPSGRSRERKRKGNIKNMANISYIKICKNCKHFSRDNKGFCPVLGNYQLINVANSCEHFDGEKYKFDRDKVRTIGERPSTFSK